MGRELFHEKWYLHNIEALDEARKSVDEFFPPDERQSGDDHYTAHGMILGFVLGVNYVKNKIRGAS